MKICKKCVLPETFIGISFDENGVCNYCNEYSGEKRQSTTGVFNDESELISYLNKYKKYKILNSKYDVLVPVSGGVDSCKALVTIVERYKLKALVFHNDHGYEDTTATENVKEICSKLDVDLVIWQHDLGFMKKLFKYLNQSSLKMSTCLICGTMLYINAIELAGNFNIPLIINGYSKGQAAIIKSRERFESTIGEVIYEVLGHGDTGFVRELKNKIKLLDEHIILQKKEDFEICKNLNKVLFIPYYMFKFYKTDKSAFRGELIDRFDWKPMKTSYPCNTTNCDMIWINIYRDLKKLNYSYYNEEYSQLIREGELTREQALADLKFNPPQGMLKRLAAEIDLNDEFCPDSVEFDAFGDDGKD